MTSFDFFAAQEEANRKSMRLRVLFFLVTVLFSVLTAYSVCYIWNPPSHRFASGSWYEVNSEYYPIISAIIFGFIMITAWLKAREIQKIGIHNLLENYGAEPIIAPFKNEDEKRLHNIAQEMAIASGLAMPTLYILPDDRSINAFTAGFDHGDTSIVVTAGALCILSRAELQGVIAHEFSHILNGDMKVNMQLISIIHGYSALSILGQQCFETRTRSKWPIGLYLIGLVLICFGSFGKLVASIIRSAHSKQREWSADATAVQFTRNPVGLRGALEKIDRSYYTEITGLNSADDFAHMFFSSGLRGFFNRVFASHPPLVERIRVLGAPNYQSPAEKTDYENLLSKLDRNSNTGVLSSLVDESVEKQSVSLADEVANKRPIRISTRYAGDLSPQALQTARLLLTSIPREVKRACEHPLRAQAIIVALVLFHGSGEKTEIINFLRTNKIFQHSFLDWIRDDGFPLLKSISFDKAAAVLGMASEQVRMLPISERRHFLTNLVLIVRWDRVHSSKEVVMLILLMSPLFDINELRTFGLQDQSPNSAQDIAMLLGFVAHTAAGETAEERQNAYNLALDKLRWHRQDVPKLSDITLEALLRSVAHVKAATPKSKQQFIGAITHSVGADNHVNENEYHLLRALCLCLGCPIPLKYAR